MQFNDTTNGAGLIQECERFCHKDSGDISGSTTLLKEFTVKINEANRKVWSWLYNSDAGWQYDDNNQSNLPQASCNLVSGADSYALPTEALTVKRIEVKDENGNWIRLIPFNLQKQNGNIGDFYSTDGVPKYYRLIGNAVIIYPASSYASANGFKVFFDRDVVDFSYTDTTKEPGFASIFHRVLAVGASLDWCESNSSNQQTIASLTNKWNAFKEEMQEFYIKRFEDNTPPIIRQSDTSFE